MPLKVIVLILVRAECVFLFVQGLGLFLHAMGGTVGYRVSESSGHFGMPIAVLVAAFILWYAAPHVARLILGPHDTSVPISGLSLEDLYRFAFVFLGLYFALSSLAPVLTWAHYTFSVAATVPSGSLEERRSLYRLFDPLITMGVGIACVMKGRQWTRRLLDREEQTERGAAPNGGLSTPASNSGVGEGPPSAS
jgi:hypothetical protein